MFNTAQKPLYQRVVDVLLDKISYEFGEGDIIKEIKDTDPEELFKKCCDLEELFKQHSWHLTDISAEDLARMMDAMGAFEKDLNSVLNKGNFSISNHAVKELVGSAKYGKENFFKTIDKIFHVVNGGRGNIQLTAIKDSKVSPLYEVRITQKARLFYKTNPNEILGFDFEHKRDDHSDVIAKLERRCRG